MNPAATPAPRTMAGTFSHLDALLDARSSRALYWRLQFIGWGGSAAFGLFFLGQHLDWEKALLISFTRAASGLAISCGLREIYRRIPWRQMQPWTLFIAIACLSFVLGFVESLALQYLVFTHIGAPPDPAVYPLLTRLGVVGRLFAFFGWSLLYFAIKVWGEFIRAELQASRSEAAARTAELHQLQAQVNPHFLFNALNSILAEKDNSRAVEGITQELADYLRYALRSQGGFAPLGDELDQLERYLRVEKSRFEDRFGYEIVADAAARAVRVPAALVLPLVENACKYGRQSGPRVLGIRVTARCDNGALLVTVANTGRWLPFDPARSHGTGLANLRRRLELLSGNRARIESAETNGWVAVTVAWPVAAAPAEIAAPAA